MLEKNIGFTKLHTNAMHIFSFTWSYFELFLQIDRHTFNFWSILSATILKILYNMQFAHHQRQQTIEPKRDHFLIYFFPQWFIYVWTIHWVIKKIWVSKELFSSTLMTLKQRSSSLACSKIWDSVSDQYLTRKSINLTTCFAVVSSINKANIFP